ncbi:MAG: TIGR02710 family CRISPR-associated CARF protein [Aestuariivita sp.]|nr:TIGR02710 family CRISPR-associated CARF protein [Aestuariivita sp.]
MTTNDKVLVLTVGTGNWKDLDATLFKPMEKSLRDGTWSKIILLPSTKTEENAIQFRSRMSEYAIEIKPLPEAEQENNADSCFNHFDKVLSEVCQHHCKTKLMIDFTRGTKAMSAAIVLAAVRHQVPRLRYVAGPRDDQGMVISGKETVTEVETTKATWRLKIEDAKKLMNKHTFSAIHELLPDVENSKLSEAFVPQEFQSEISRLIRFANFWTAWDRLDYAVAVACTCKFKESEHQKLQNEISWLKCLKNEPQESNTPDYHNDMAKWLLYVAFDLLENGYRRIKQHQFEDALLRAYRIVEMIGQVRLFEKDYNSACLDPYDNYIAKFRLKNKKKSADFGSIEVNGRKKLTASRFIAARFLNYLGDPLGQKLIDFDKSTKTHINTSNRNHSILIHGFSATSTNADHLNKLYDQIKKLLIEFYPEMASKFKLDRFGYFF